MAARKSEEERGRLLALEIERRESRFVGMGASRIDTSHRDAPVCPSCGAETRTNTFMRESMDGAQYHSSCMACGALFDVTVHVTVTYSTEVRS